MTNSTEHKSWNKHGHPESKERLKKCVFKKFIKNQLIPCTKTIYKSYKVWTFVDLCLFLYKKQQQTTEDWFKIQGFNLDCCY